MITIYTKDYCPYCVKAKNLLSSLGATYEEVDITATPELIMDLAKKSGMRTVPQIFVNDVCLGGFDNINALHMKGELTPKLGI
ncbi:glutaredoxin 3 [Candidatus Gracilibacteria bacterium]|nr:glutaredoxin 3 [Candidatus Gracilibacteria bacterium]